MLDCNPSSDARTADDSAFVFATKRVQSRRKTTGLQAKPLLVFERESVVHALGLLRARYEGEVLGFHIRLLERTPHGQAFGEFQYPS